MIGKVDEAIEMEAFQCSRGSMGTIRHRIIKDLEGSIVILSTFVLDENIRQFASEVSRPRGVWCKHIEELKRESKLALPILEALKSDESKYV